MLEVTYLRIFGSFTFRNERCRRQTIINRGAGLKNVEILWQMGEKA